MSSPFKFMLLGLSDEHTVYKKQVNIISSKYHRGTWSGESCEREGWEIANGLGKGEPEGRRLMQFYWMREGDESEANAAGKLDTRSESRERAFDHHDTLDT